MSKFTRTLSSFLVVLLLLIGCTMVYKYSKREGLIDGDFMENLLNKDNSVISEEDYCCKGLSVNCSVLPELQARFEFCISETYYKKLLSENNVEIGYLMIRKSSLPQTEMLRYNTKDAIKVILNARLKESVADSNGYLTVYGEIFSPATLTEVWHVVGYVNNGKEILYTKTANTRVQSALEQGYLTFTDEDLKKSLLPYLSDEFKKEHGIG